MRILSTAGAGEPFQLHDDLSFQRPVNAKALAYWRARAAGRAMPARADIDPVDMRGFIANVGLVDVLADGRETPEFRVRLAGTAVEEVFGPVTGKTLSELPPYFATRWTDLFTTVAGHGAALRV